MVSIFILRCAHPETSDDYHYFADQPTEIIFPTAHIQQKNNFPLPNNNTSNMNKKLRKIPNHLSIHSNFPLTWYISEKDMNSHSFKIIKPGVNQWKITSLVYY